MLFTDDAEHRRGNLQLQCLRVPLRNCGFLVYPLSLPALHGGTDAPLLAELARGGIPVLGPRGLTAEEFPYWQRDEPDLHDLKDGQPVRMSEIKQESHRAARALLAVTRGFRGDVLYGK
ncbi:hypothetical protein [Pseudoroseomonas cervicalis]|uniref:hypothetical protein n=1 Tax=Teichococcus cervicalis TaxID=204525 RepID=UPI0022F1749D|nr:hypothetical protein [Pseudoroseomonas cervicalis]WBV42562.1 hypothetical protein PFY06_15155 [Pseudoroseomonas cervicalis]